MKTIDKEHQDKCTTCGSPVKVVGNVTKHYEPVDDKYIISEIQMADYENIAICNKTKNTILCHFNINNNYKETLEVAKKITNFINNNL